MKTLPPLPSVADAPPDLLDGGHLWIREYVDGSPLRFQVQESGVVRFGDGNRVFKRDAIPEPYLAAVRHVRERIDRDALRRAVDDVEDIVFFGASMHKRAIDYDWQRTPPFLGFDVWTDAGERFLAVDAVEKIYEQLGLQPVNTFEKEVRAVDFDPESYDVPASRWYDGPAAGVVLHNKAGTKAKLIRRATFDADADDSSPDSDATAGELARTYATDDRFRDVAARVEAMNRPVTFETMYDRVFESIVREAHARLFDGSTDVDRQAFRSEVAARTRAFVANRSG